MKNTKDPIQSVWVHTGRDVGPRPYPIPSSDKTVITSVVVPMKDGVRLRGDLYMPTNGSGNYPAIVEITPYGAQCLAQSGRTYAARGYLFLAIDCRGRYRSEGDWEPLTHDKPDGQAVINWLADFEKCNGEVGTRGHSYSGYNQMLMAIDAPSALKAMVVGVAPGDAFYNTPFQGGAYDLNDLFWLMDSTGRVSAEDNESKPGKFDDPDYDEDEDDEDEDTEEEKEHDALLDYALSTKPFIDVDLRLGLYHQQFREWASHWQLDDYWKDRSVLHHIESIDVPTLQISGIWDGNGRGSTLFFEALRRGGGKHSRSQKLLFGPWDHDLSAPDCDDLPESEMDAIERAAMRDSMNEEMAWFDFHMKGIPFGASQQARVELFMTGINRWFKFDDWPIPGAKTQKLYLEPGKKRGGLSDKVSKQDSSVSYCFDPLNPTPYGHKDTDAERMPFDNSQLQKERKDIALFESKKVDGEPLALAGPLKATIYASADTSDFDIVASLYDLYPDGRSIFLADGILRARFAGGFEKPKLLKRGKVAAFEVDLWHIVHVFRPGHKVRLQVASGSYLRFDVNGCTGKDLATDTETEIAHINIHSGPDFPSCIEADVVPMTILESDHSVTSFASTSKIGGT